jgi:hypothetical protein
MGTSAKRTSNQRMKRMAKSKRLISAWWRATRGEGKTFVQKCSPLPNETWRFTLRPGASGPRTQWEKGRSAYGSACSPCLSNMWNVWW